MGIEGSQSGHHHHPTRQMTGMLYALLTITLHERYTWTNIPILNDNMGVQMK